MTDEQTHKARDLLLEKFTNSTKKSIRNPSVEFNPKKTGIAVYIRTVIKDCEKFDYASRLISSHYNCRNFTCAIAICGITIASELLWTLDYFATIFALLITLSLMTRHMRKGNKIYGKKRLFFNFTLFLELGNSSAQTA
jgi:hypothetical protein